MQPAYSSYRDASTSRARACGAIARTASSLIIISILWLACAYVLRAQGGDEGGLPTSSGGTTTGTLRGSTLENGKSGEFMIEVNVWGYVRSPGKYSVPISARLIDVISLAGGPTERAELEHVKVVHDQNVDSTIKQLVRVIDLENYKQTGNPEDNPVLYPNDTIIIPGDNLNTFNQVVSIVSNVAVVTLSVIGLIFAFKKSSGS
jgi:hypothetical protein